MPARRRVNLSDPTMPITAVVVIVDESGSMLPSVDATVSGFNEWLATMKAAPEAVATYLTLTFFSSHRGTEPNCRVRIVDQLIGEVPPLTHADYRPAGNTPLYDAIGQTISALDARLAEDPVDRVLMVTLTDGQENSSQEFTTERIKELIQAKQTGPWTFVYLGTDQDAWAARQVSQAVGATGQSANFVSSPRSTHRESYRVMAASSGNYLSQRGQQVNHAVANFWAGSELDQSNAAPPATNTAPTSTTSSTDTPPAA